jgi:hypothetical protein
MTLSRELQKNKLDVLGVQEVKWDRGGTEAAGEYTFSMQRGIRIMKKLHAPLSTIISYQQSRGLIVLVRGIWTKGYEETGGWRGLHNEKLHSSNCLPSLIRTTNSKSMRWAEHVAQMVAKGYAYRILIQKPERKWPLRKWADNIKMDLGDVG